MMNKKVAFWSVVVAVLMIGAAVGPHFLCHDPYLVDLMHVNEGPGKEFWMGTDSVGRCIACRLIEGAFRSIYAAVLVVLLSFTIGTLVGLLSGYYGGIADTILMRFVDSVQAFPSLVFTVAVAGMLGKGMVNCIIAMTAVGWVSYARLARSQVISLKERTFIQAAKTSGFSSGHIMFHTILPNSLRPLIVYASMHVGNTILNFAGLSYLGLGTAPPFPEWGTMLNDGQSTLQLAPWSVFFPGTAILIVVMIMGMFGDSINEFMNPKQSKESGTA